MTMCDYGTNTAQKRLNMAAILKFKMAAEDAFEKNGTNSGFVRKGIRMQKNLGSTSIGNFALDYITPYTINYRPFSHCIDQAGLGAFTAKSGRKHYNPPPLTVMCMNFDSLNFPSFCSLSAIISFQTCSNKCILHVLSFHKCIKIKYKMVNMYGVFRD